MHKLFLTTVLSTVIGSTAVAETRSECVARKEQGFLVAVIDQDADERYRQLMAADEADDGQWNYPHEDYFAILEPFEQIRIEQLPDMTFWMVRWFRFKTAQEDLPIVVFLLQNPLLNPEGQLVNHTSDSPMIYVPDQDRVVTAKDFSKIFAQDTCDLRAKLFGEEQGV